MFWTRYAGASILLFLMLIHLGQLYPRNDMTNCKLIINDD